MIKKIYRKTGLFFPFFLIHISNWFLKSKIGSLKNFQKGSWGNGKEVKLPTNTSFYENEKLSLQKMTLKSVCFILCCKFYLTQYWLIFGDIYTYPRNCQYSSFQYLFLYHPNILMSASQSLENVTKICLFWCKKFETYVKLFHSMAGFRPPQSLEIHQGIPFGWQRLKYLSHHLLLFLGH